MVHEGCWGPYGSEIREDEETGLTRMSDNFKLPTRRVRHGGYRSIGGGLREKTSGS